MSISLRDPKNLYPKMEKELAELFGAKVSLTPFGGRVNNSNLYDHSYGIYVDIAKSTVKKLARVVIFKWEEAYRLIDDHTLAVYKTQQKPNPRCTLFAKLFRTELTKIEQGFGRMRDETESFVELKIQIRCLAYDPLKPSTRKWQTF